MRPAAQIAVRVSDVLLVEMALVVHRKWTRRLDRWEAKGYIENPEVLRDVDRAFYTIRGRATSRGRRLTDRVLLALSHPKASMDTTSTTGGDDA